MKKIEMGKKYTWMDGPGTVRYTDGECPGLPVAFELKGGRVLLLSEYGYGMAGFCLEEVSPCAG